MGKRKQLFLKCIDHRRSFALGATVFPWTYLFYLFFVAWDLVVRQQRNNLFFHILVVTLMIGATTHYSAGWMLWGAASYFLLLVRLLSKTIRYVWRFWSLLFILRWALVSHSPVADSLGIFVTKFLHRKIDLPMGYIYQVLLNNIGVNFAKSAAHLSEILFASTSICFGYLVLKSKDYKSTFLNDRTSTL